jgi:N-acetylneuraminic acid mutarotase
MRTKIVFISTILILYSTNVGVYLDWNNKIEEKDISQNVKFSWTNLNPSIKPNAMVGHSMVYDSDSDKIILFGGFDGEKDYNETWLYDYNTNNWTNLNPFTAPSPRRAHSMAYDSKLNKFVLFGGYNETKNLIDTWVYSLLDNNWTQVFPSTSPDARRAQRMTYDNELDYIIMQGGINDNSVNNYADTWLYKVDNNTWIKVSNGPVAYDHGLVYNSFSKNHILLMDGQTWSYTVENNTWRKLTTTGQPPTNLLHYSMTYDLESNAIVIYGGDADGTYGTTENWIFFCSNNSWISINESNKPSGRLGHNAAYDSESNVLVLFGGVSYKGGVRNDETWSFKISNSSINSLSTTITPSNSIESSQTHNSKSVPLFNWILIPIVFSFYVFISKIKKEKS